MFFTKQIQTILNKTSDELDELEAKEIIKLVEDELNTDRYKYDLLEDLPSPCGKEQSYTNPAIKGYCESLDWTPEGWKPIHKTDVLEKYPEYVPTDESIDTILKYSPILEIGAGNGYWSHVLMNAGCNIRPTDIYPNNLKSDALPDDYWELDETTKYNFIDVPRIDNPTSDLEKTWCHVELASHTCVSDFPNKTILLCFPPNETWTEDLLNYMNVGQKLIFIGEWAIGNTATPFFFKQLDSSWDLCDDFPIYNWASTSAHGYVFEKTS